MRGLSSEGSEWGSCQPGAEERGIGQDAIRATDAACQDKKGNLPLRKQRLLRWGTLQ
jgi:hypothetical protein